MKALIVSLESFQKGEVPIYRTIFEIPVKGRFLELKKPAIIDIANGTWVNCQMGETKGNITRSKNKTYYKFKMTTKEGKIEVVAHRVIYFAYKGVFDFTKEVDHIDNNSENNCFRNLQLLTHSDNVKKDYVPRVVYHKLQVEDVKNIKRLLGEHELTYKEIADKYNVSFSCIEAIANKRHWKEV